MLRVDETIQKAIEVRDRKASPVIHQTKMQTLALNEKLSSGV